MRSMFKRLFAVAASVGICCSCMMSACAAEKRTDKALRIGVTIYRKDDAFINSLCTDLQNIAKDKVRGENKIQLNIVDGQSSQTEQDDQVDRFLSRGYSVLCVNLVDRTAAATIVSKAKRANVPVVFFNREPVEEDLRMWGKAYYVGADAAQSGTIQGKIIRNAYMKNPKRIDRNGDGKIQYVMLEGEEGHQDALLRTEYSIRYLVKLGLKVQKLADNTANWQRAQAAEKMSQFIRQYGERTEAVFCNNDEMALGAIDAIRDSKIKNRPAVVGVDGTKAGCDAIRKGEMLGTAYNDAESQAKAIFELSYDLARGQKIDSSKLKDQHYIYIPYQMITAANVNKYVG